MSRYRSKLTALAVAFTILVCIWAEPAAAACATGQACATAFGIFGVTRGETARAYGVNTGDENGVIAIIRILDLAGNVLAESGELRLELGQAAFFDFNSDDLDFGTALRVPIRVEVSIWDPGIKIFRKIIAIASVEVFDSTTGKTAFVAALPYIEQK